MLARRVSLCPFDVVVVVEVCLAHCNRLKFLVVTQYKLFSPVAVLAAAKCQTIISLVFITH